MAKRNIKKSKPSIWVSQNFLTSSKTIHRLLKTTSLNKNDQVIEIGPGKGHITRLLLKKCKRVLAIEIDDKLYNKLSTKFSTAPNLTLYHQDFLKWQLPANEYKVFSNIPFCITTKILRKLTECRNPPVEAWLVIDKGVAKCLMGKPKETLNSLLIKPLFDVNITYYFQREDFYPRPGVDVVMIHLKRKPNADIAANQWRAYRSFVNIGLQESGHGLLHLFSKKQLYKALRTAGVQNDIVPAEILYVQWLCLFRCYWKYVLGRK